MAIWAADVCSRAARQLICIEPTGLRLRCIGKTDPQCGTVQFCFHSDRAASLAHQLVLALGPSPRIHYFCNPSNIDGRVYVCMYMVRIRVSVTVWVRFRVCHDMFRTRSSMLDRLPK